jgi:hypothetical protein
MEEDPIMQELRQIRRDLLKEAGGDLGKLLERANREAPLLLAPFRKAAEERAKVAARRRREESPRPSKKAKRMPSFRRASQAKLPKM